MVFGFAECRSPASVPALPTIQRRELAVTPNEVNPDPVSNGCTICLPPKAFEARHKDLVAVPI